MRKLPLIALTLLLAVPAWSQTATELKKELFPKMDGDENLSLQRMEGRWPEYPQRLLQYAHKYDLSVPGVTLPGPPKRWDATYGTRPPARPTN